MLKDMFDFSKKRTPKEAALFCVYHCALVLAVVGILRIAGI